MSLKIINIDKPEIPYRIPLPKGLSPNDKLQISLNIQPKSPIEISLKASDVDKIDSRIPLNVLVSLDGILCRCGKNKTWEISKNDNTFEILPGNIFLTLSLDDTEFRVEVDGKLYSTFQHKFPPSVTEFFEINVIEGSSSINSIIFTKEIKWLGSNFDLPCPVNALKCGKDSENNDIYVGRGLKNNSLLTVHVNPGVEALVVCNGRAWPIRDYELIEDNSYYGWKLICDEKILPENAIEGGFNDKGEKTYIGRIENEGSTILGSVNSQNLCLSVPVKGKETKFSSRFEILVALSPIEVKEKLNSVKNEPKIDQHPVKQEIIDCKCIICFIEDKTCALINCGHKAMCEGCVKIYLESHNRCPVCRSQVTSYLRVYDS